MICEQVSTTWLRVCHGRGWRAAAAPGKTESAHRYMQVMRVRSFGRRPAGRAGHACRALMDRQEYASLSTCAVDPGTEETVMNHLEPSPGAGGGQPGRTPHRPCAGSRPALAAGTRRRGRPPTCPASAGAAAEQRRLPPRRAWAAWPAGPPRPPPRPRPARARPPWPRGPGRRSRGWRSTRRWRPSPKRGRAGRPGPPGRGRP